MDYQLEHANITVRNVDKAVQFLTTAFPDFRIRGTNQTQAPDEPLKWLHVGTDTTYVALTPSSGEPDTPHQFYTEPGVNHVGFAVDDTDAVQQRMEAAGYETKYADPHPHRKRLYVTDDDGMEWEFVEYFSDDPAERNDYLL